MDSPQRQRDPDPPWEPEPLHLPLEIPIVPRDDEEIPDEAGPGVLVIDLA